MPAHKLMGSHMFFSEQLKLLVLTEKAIGLLRTTQDDLRDPKHKVQEQSEAGESVLLVIYVRPFPSPHELLPRTWKLAGDSRLWRHADGASKGDVEREGPNEQPPAFLKAQQFQRRNQVSGGQRRRRQMK